MDAEAEKKAMAKEEDVVEMTQNPSQGGDLRIQFTPAPKPYRSRAEGKDEATFIPSSRRSQSVGSGARRRDSTTPLPPVLSAKEKSRRKAQKDEEKKHLDISEHLMSPQDVADKYNTNINMGSPSESLGLTTSQAEQLLLQHGLNILTPPSKRHWILKFWDCLSSLFNLLLILAGFLEYILLGINFKGNIQNVSLKTNFLTS